ncbi:FAD-dependent monooxygenase [Variovorax sp. J22R24]|uniref:FAD-dependent monooxygenase n=1 Tax=Variovorax gracilis TaxID=3053502 RepID=UPI002577265C|nr:FAD-dependent monooxygenase [Variovorax sp. J22R24]MDM0109650.1 FAD-dependent monooxygenase [Variovorax sp. J22R24]
MTRKDLSMAIIGGGMGGLTAGLAALQVGIDVQVYEQATSLREIGAGVQISPNASRVLHRLGLADALARTGVKPLAWHQRRWDNGRTLLRTPLAHSMEAAFGFPHYQMHRADVLNALVDAFPQERLHAGERFAAFVDHGDHVEVSFESGRRIEVDVLVGADGIHSSVRRALHGSDDARFTGCVAYRGLAPADRLSGLGLELTSQVWMGPDKHFVHYFVRNQELVNFVAVIEQDCWTAESWIDRGDVDEARSSFAGWHPQVQTIIGAVDETFKWALFDRPPMERWSMGRVTLLGDACHAMLPFMAQGAAQAIEDAATLTACLASRTHNEVTDALAQYETLRLPRASRLQALSAANKSRFHLVDGPSQEARDAQMALGNTDWSLDAVAWLYGHDAWSTSAVG